MDLSLARLSLLDLAGTRTDGVIDDVPEEFIGQLVKDVVMHEIGHVLGLRHNFKASSIYSLEQINSAEWREQKRPIAGSVMDYLAFNYNPDERHTQGPHFMTTIGPYDRWAIEYGYALDTDQAKLDAILSRANDPENVYLTDEDLYGPDPRARTRDLGSNVLDFVDAEMAMIQRLRGRIVERALKKGGAYQKARDAYLTLLGLHTRDLNTLARYIGGIHVHRDRVGQSDRNPTEPVPAAEQRRALNQVIQYAFNDKAFGLSPALLEKVSFDKWFDRAAIQMDLPDPQLDVHDLVLGTQASTLTVIFNPATLRRVYDNEFRIPSDHDALTLAELLTTVQSAIWTELESDPAHDHTARSPFISSLRRNLQREHLERMIALSLPGGMTGAVGKQVATLASSLLRDQQRRIDRILGQPGAQLDPYSAAHLQDARTRIAKALDAMYVYR